jgi:hypothetical protein
MDGVAVHFEHIQRIKLLYLTEIGRGIHRSIDIIFYYDEIDLIDCHSEIA